MIGFLVAQILIGVVVGIVATRVVPDLSTGLLSTIVPSVTGSCVGGFLGYVPFGTGLNGGVIWASSIVGSINGAIIGLLSFHAVALRRRAISSRRSRLAEISYLDVGANSSTS